MTSYSEREDKRKELLRKTNDVIQNMSDSLVNASKSETPVRPEDIAIIHNIQKLAQVVKDLVEDHVGYDELAESIMDATGNHD